MICNFFLSAPFLSSSRGAYKTVLQKLDLSGRKKFYDLGSGSGKMVGKVAQKYKGMQCIGIEKNPGAYFLAQIRNLFLKRKVRYLYKNFYDIDLSDADAVYAYLFPEPMVKLEEKFERELKPGAILISAAFKLPNKKPAEIYESRNPLSKIFIYKY